MTNVVIGSGGYTGFNLVKRLSKDQEVLAVLSDKHQLRQSGKFYIQNKIKMLPKIESLLSEKLNSESKIIYLAGYGTSDHYFNDIELLTHAYVTGMVQALEIARNFNCKIVIGGSYWELINNPKTNTNINLYASFQAAQNKILEYFSLEYGTSIIKVFLADSYGPNDWRPKLLQTILNTLKTGHVIKMGSPKQIIAPIYINDVVEDLVDIMNLESSILGSVTYLQLVPDKVYSLEEFIDIIQLVTKKTIPVKWNEIEKIRLNIEHFPISNSTYKSRRTYLSLKEGLNNVLNLKD